MELGDMYLKGGGGYAGETFTSVYELYSQGNRGNGADIYLK